MTPFANRLSSAFQRLAWSNLSAQSAEQIALVAAPVVAVVALGAGEAESGLLQIALTLPFLLFALPAGLLADRVSRPRLMASAEALRAFSLVVTAVLLGAGQLSLWLLAFLGFVGAGATVIYSVAAPALVPALVPSAFLATANARVELARTVAFTAGPALGGALVGWTGASLAFGLAAGLSTLAFRLLLGLPESPQHNLPAQSRRPLREAADGIAFVARHPLLRPVLLTQFLFNAAFFVLVAAFFPYAHRHLSLDASGIGLIFAVDGAGMVLGALLAPAILRRLAFGLVVGIGPLSGLLGAVCVALTIWYPTPLLAGLGFFLFGVGPILWVISTTTLRQAVTPRDLLGRVSAVSVLTQGARPLGAGLGALVGGMLGAEACLLVAAMGFVAQAAIIWTSPAIGLARQPRMIDDGSLATGA
jgi:predicted MFS family arabinose efflux permease